MATTDKAPRHAATPALPRFAVVVAVQRRDGVTETRVLRDVRAAERRALRATAEGRQATLTLVRLEPVLPADALDAELVMLEDVEGVPR